MNNHLGTLACLVLCACPPPADGGDVPEPEKSLFASGQGLNLCVAANYDPNENPGSTIGSLSILDSSGPARPVTPDEDSGFRYDGSCNEETDGGIVIEGGERSMLLNFDLIDDDRYFPLVAPTDIEIRALATIERMRTGMKQVGIFDAQGLRFAASDGLTNLWPEGEMETLGFTVEPTAESATPLAYVDSFCGRKTERLFRVTCSTGESVDVRSRSSARACGMKFYAIAAWVGTEWQCTDLVNPVVWYAVREDL